MGIGTRQGMASGNVNRDRQPLRRIGTPRIKRFDARWIWEPKHCSRPTEGRIGYHGIHWASVLAQQNVPLLAPPARTGAIGFIWHHQWTCGRKDTPDLRFDLQRNSCPL
jgi:hypothetical protein